MGATDASAQIAHDLDEARERAPAIEEAAESGELEERLRALEDEVQTLSDAARKGQPPKRRRWKAWGRLASGLVLALADGGIAVVAFPTIAGAPLAAIPVTNSVVTGVGVIFDGIDKLQGE